MESPAGNSQLADAIDLSRMLEQVLAAGSPGPAVTAGIRVTLRNMRDLMIEAIAIREQEAAISLPGAAQAPVEARPSAAPLKLSEQMSISSTSHPVVALEEADQVQAGATSSDADQIAIKRGALRASIERIVERMG